MNAQRWIICPTCEGEGKHSRHLGAFTSSEWGQEDDDFKERYLSGDYDRPCDRCKGTAKLQVAERHCSVCDDALPDQDDELSCCGTDDFPEPGEIRETGR